MDAITLVSFRAVLQQVLDGTQPVDALLEHPEFQRRGHELCRRFARNRERAGTLYQEVSIKVWKKVRDRFRPDDTREDGNFFGWLHEIARTTSISMGRDETRQVVRMPAADRPVEEFNLAARADDLDGPLLLGEFLESIKSRPDHHQLAIRLWTKTYCFREIARILKKRGVKCSHVSVRTWVRDAISDFLKERRR